MGSISWVEPRFWQDEQYNSFDKPVVGVSWFEAVAFCQWLSDVTGEKIMLPTEEQWQYAARGDGNKAYPWGNEWDGGKCRSSVGGKSHSAGSPSPVTQYQGIGDSLFGVVDMAGNVWEWCLTYYNSEITGVVAPRLVLGGSWSDPDIRLFGYDHRGSLGAAKAGFNHGFRIIRS